MHGGSYQHWCSALQLSCCAAEVVSSNCQHSITHCSLVLICFSSEHLFFPQLEPVGEKTDSQPMEEEIILNCPSEVSYCGVCVYVEVLGVAGGLCEPLPSAWSSVSVRLSAPPHTVCATRAP